MAAAAAAGPIMQGYGNYLSGQAQSEAYDYQAQVAENNVQVAKQQGAYDASRMMVMASKKIGSQEAGFAASGVSLQSGSAMAVLASSAATAELDRQNILHGADIKAVNFANQASIDRIAAKNTKSASLLGLAAGGIGGAGSAYANSIAGSTATENQTMLDENEFASVGGAN